MLDILRRWLWPHRTGIFAFFDGTRSRRADPMAVSRALFSHPTFSWEDHPKLIDVDDPAVSMDALRITAEAVRDAFTLPSVEDGGLTEIECVDLLASFVAYLASLKKSTETPRNSPELTGPTPSRGSTTKSAADSGSMETASNTGEPSAS